MALKKGVGDDDWEEGFQADMAAIVGGRDVMPLTRPDSELRRRRIKRLNAFPLMIRLSAEVASIRTDPSGQMITIGFIIFFIPIPGICDSHIVLYA